MKIFCIIFLFTISILLLASPEDKYFMIGFILFTGGILFTIYGFFTGFINYPPTQGIHQGIITSVDLEGVFFRRYEIYLKSGGYSEDSRSDETKYLIYESEKELSEELSKYIGKEVKLYYGHDGGYIPWNSCGTYHIKSVELIEE